MKRLAVGFFVGIGSSVVIVLIAMSGGEPFQTMVLKARVENETGIIATERFVILFDGVRGTGGGSCMITYAGRHGTLPALWSGYGTGWGAGDKGITAFHTYNPDRGTAVLFYFGRLILVEDSGRYLRVQDRRFPLGDKTVVVAVAADGHCKSISDDQAEEIYDGLDSWYKDRVVSLAPPPPLEQRGVPLEETSAPAGR